MKDIWFSDSRDIVKWGVLAHLAKPPHKTLAVQLAFYRQEKPSQYKLRHLTGSTTQNHIEFPELVLRAFERRIDQIKEKTLGINLELYDAPFKGQYSGGSTYRDRYITTFLNWLTATRKERTVVLLADPDTGLEPTKKGPEYIKETELQRLFEGLKDGDWLVLYQHAPRKTEWIEDHRGRLSRLLAGHAVEVFDCPEVAEDVAFFAVRK